MIAAKMTQIRLMTGQTLSQACHGRCTAQCSQCPDRRLELIAGCVQQRSDSSRRPARLCRPQRVASSSGERNRGTRWRGGPPQAGLKLGACADPSRACRWRGGDVSVWNGLRVQALLASSGMTDSHARSERQSILNDDACLLAVRRTAEPARRALWGLARTDGPHGSLAARSCDGHGGLAGDASRHGRGHGRCRGAFGRDGGVDRRDDHVCTSVAGC